MPTIRTSFFALEAPLERTIAVFVIQIPGDFPDGAKTFKGTTEW